MLLKILSKGVLLFNIKEAIKSWVTSPAAIKPGHKLSNLTELEDWNQIKLAMGLFTVDIAFHHLSTNTMWLEHKYNKTWTQIQYNLNTNAIRPCNGAL